MYYVVSLSTYESGPYVVCLADQRPYQHRYRGRRGEGSLVRPYEGSWAGPDMGIVGNQHACRAFAEKYIADFVYSYPYGS
jgi:hypothetical protein